MDSTATQESECSATVPVLSGHSHYDYQRSRLLGIQLRIDSLVEVDIHLVCGSILVGHDKDELEGAMTLQSLYLNPLRKYVWNHDGCVYLGHQLILLIDIKSEPGSAYEILLAILAQYSDIVTIYSSRQVEEKAIAVVISSNRPREIMMNEDVRYATYDGRL